MKNNNNKISFYKNKVTLGICHTFSIKIIKIQCLLVNTTQISYWKLQDTQRDAKFNLVYIFKLYNKDPSCIDFIMNEN